MVVLGGAAEKLDRIEPAGAGQLRREYQYLVPFAVASAAAVGDVHQQRAAGAELDPGRAGDRGEQQDGHDSLHGSA